jgi:beta-phosphoglucomutase
VTQHFRVEAQEAGRRYQGVIFDLDGVLVDTAKQHWAAWRRLGAELGFDVTEAFNERLKGVNRVQSLELILQAAGLDPSPAERTRLTDRKNGWYVELLSNIDESDVLPGALDVVRWLRRRSIRCAIGSASKNAPLIVERLGILSLFDAIVDGNKVDRPKPDPEVFLVAAEELGLPALTCVVFEDAQAGILAARAAGMSAVGVGRREDLESADWVVPNLVDIGELLDLLFPSETESQ